MKESFQVSPVEATSSSYWPNNAFQDISMQFFEKLTRITHRLMLAMAVGKKFCHYLKNILKNLLGMHIEEI